MQFKEDSQLFIDLIRSFLRWKGLMRRGPIKFWHYKTREGVKFILRRNVWDSGAIMETWWLNEYLRHPKRYSGRSNSN